MRLTQGSRVLDLDSPAVMGIVNVTPDSFSDGGRFANAHEAIDAAFNMLADGARIIDVGGESSRPGARPVPASVQLERVLPVVRAMRDEPSAFVSVDTGNPEVIRAVVDAGAQMINDVFGLRQAGALQAAGESGALACIMHMQGTPETMQDEPRYERLPGDVVDYLAARMGEWEAAGFGRDRLLLDPGFGFGKRDDHNLCLLANLGELAALGPPVVVGLSRKAMLGRLTGRDVGDRLAAGLAAAVMAVERGARIVRTHDVPETVDALRIATATLAVGPDQATKTGQSRSGNDGGDFSAKD